MTRWYYKLISILCATLLATNAPAQVQRCHTMEYLEELKKNDPQIEQNISNARTLAAQYAVREHGQRRSQAILQVPVVVHVMHNGESVGSGKNISDAQIISQITVLNEDYQALNSDLGDVPAHFTSLIGNPEIEFCLATTDPDGNLTYGIDRVSMGSAGSWSDNRKPTTTWDATQYLNIWVTQISGGTLGYATFPGTSLDYDGVVIDYRYFGRAPANPFSSDFDLGRTVTHEVGHWLGLDHTFNGGCSGTSAATCGTNGDRICDTPPTSNPNYGCSLSTSRNTCTETPVDRPDMWMNFLDYMDDACLYMFTQGQVDVMRGVLNTSRSDILGSTACDASEVFSFSGKVTDAGTGIGIANAKVRFQGPRTVELTADANGNFSVPNFRDGSYTVYAGSWGYMTTSLNTAIDSTSPPLIIPIEPGYYDDFILDYGWSVSGSAISGIWERDVPVGTSFNSEVSNPGTDVAGDFGDQCYVTGNGGGAAGTDDVDDGNTILTSPVFNLAAYSNPYLSYHRWFFNDGGDGNPNDAMTVSLSNGIETKVIETVNATANQWNSVEVRVMDLLAPTASMRFIFETSDQNPGHLVEAGLDGFRIVDSLLPVTSVLVSGTISTEFGSGINAVTVAATGGANPTASTNADGNYSLSFNAGDSPVITPGKNNDISSGNGITTLDILLIQQHILGEEKLGSPYKLIAADANASHSVSTLDVLLIRSVILQTETAFPSGRLWAFVPHDHVFQDPENPFPITQSRAYSNLTADLAGQDFIGMKLGDVNNSWDPNTPKRGTAGDVQFMIGECALYPGNEIAVPVKVKDFKNITGYQFTLVWNPKVLSLLEVNNGILSGYFNSQRSAEGMLSTVWYDELTEPVTLEDDATAFELKFKVTGLSGSQSGIMIGPAPLPPEAYNENFELLNIVPQNGMVKVGEEDGLHASLDGCRISVVPNPVSSSAKLIISVPNDALVKIAIYDCQGKQVKELIGNYPAGEHVLQWDGTDDHRIPLSEGLYHARLVGAGGSAHQKILILR